MAVKYSMELMDRPVGPPRRPLQPLTAAEMTWVKSELSAIGVFDSEPRGWKM